MKIKNIAIIIPLLFSLNLITINSQEVPNPINNPFNNLDTNNDQAITPQESGPQVWNHLKKFDKNQDQKLTLTEFQQRFQQFDKNADGYISLTEIPKRMRKPARKLDKNNDNKLEPTELLTLPQQPIPTTIPTHSNISYSSDYKKSVLDLWLPQSTIPTPIVIYFHGGGLKNGNKSRIVLKEHFLALPNQHKIAFASVGYPLIRDLKKTHSSEIENKKTILKHTTKAIQFLKQHCEKYNLDPNQFIVAGSSAGAAISEYLTYAEDLNIQACLALQHSGLANILASYINKGEPPLILYTISGPEDKTHHPKDAMFMKKHCDKVGVPCHIFGTTQSGLPQIPGGENPISHAIYILAEQHNKN